MRELVWFLVSVPRPKRPRSPRTRLEPDARRSQLLALGLSVFSERAYDEVSIDDLARAAGISKGLLYHYFPTKRDFYVAALREAGHQLLEKTKTRAGASALEQLREGIDTYHAYVSRHGASYAALLRGGIGSDKEVAQIVDEIRELFIVRLVEGLGIGEASPLVRAALRGWIGFLEVTVIDWLERRSVDRIALRELQIEVLLAALRATLGTSTADYA
jgi:AcrR family transcriptional regulator